MPDPEMWVGGNEDGAAIIFCSKKRCLVPGPGHPEGHYYLEIAMPVYATPREIDRAWHQHRLEHSS